MLRRIFNLRMSEILITSRCEQTHLREKSRNDANRMLQDLY